MFDVEYFFHVLFVCVSEFKCCKNDELTENVGYLFFIDEYYSAEINTRDK